MYKFSINQKPTNNDAQYIYIYTITEYDIPDMTNDCNKNNITKWFSYCDMGCVCMGVGPRGCTINLRSIKDYNAISEKDEFYNMDSPQLNTHTSACFLKDT